MSKKWKIILIISLLGNLAIFYVAVKALEYRAHINEYLDKYTYIVQEFSRREKYAEADKKLISKGPAKNRIVFIGTQITENWDVQKYFPKYEAVNRGILGQRVSGFLLRFRPDVIELNPEAVVIEFSSFDFRQQNNVKEFEDYVACMAELAAYHQIKPLATTVIPPCQGVIDLGDYSIIDSLAEFNNWLREYCRENNFDFVDFNKIVSGQNGYLTPELSTGVIGLNEEGYKRISKAVLQVLDSKE
jgi:lysophospholipase L1-like esterase